jgi:hypothetical protein
MLKHQMKLKTRILILAILLVAALVALVLLNPPRLRLTVHFVDEDTGQPINGRIITQEYWPYPVLSSMKSLPPWLQGWASTRSVPVRNGLFRVSTIESGQKREFQFFVEEFRSYHLEYHASANGHALFTSPKSQTSIHPGQKEISIPLYQPLIDSNKVSPRGIGWFMRK